MGAGTYSLDFCTSRNKRERKRKKKKEKENKNRSSFLSCRLAIHTRRHTKKGKEKEKRIGDGIEKDRTSSSRVTASSASCGRIESRRR